MGHRVKVQCTLFFFVFEGKARADCREEMDALQDQLRRTQALLRMSHYL